MNFLCVSEEKFSQVCRNLLSLFLNPSNKNAWKPTIQKVHITDTRTNSSLLKIWKESGDLLRFAGKNQFYVSQTNLEVRGGSSPDFLDSSYFARQSGTCKPGLFLGWKRFFHEICPCLYALFYSYEREYTMYKAILGFPLGIALGLMFYFCVIDRLHLPGFLRFMMGSMLITTLALGYARSIKMRCMVWLIFPCFFGKTGRGILLTMAVGALLTGPVSNTMGNFRESVRSVTCMTEMMINITLTRFELTGRPIFNIVKGFVVRLQASPKKL